MATGYQTIYPTTAQPSPRRPRAYKRATPPTTGGNTIDNVQSARTNELPRNSTRAKTQAKGTPNTTDRSVESREVCKEIRRASTESESNVYVPNFDHGARQSRPVSGNKNSDDEINAMTTSVFGGRDGRRLVNFPPLQK